MRTNIAAMYTVVKLAFTLVTHITAPKPPRNLTSDKTSSNVCGMSHVTFHEIAIN